MANTDVSRECEWRKDGRNTAATAPIICPGFVRDCKNTKISPKMWRYISAVLIIFAIFSVILVGSCMLHEPSEKEEAISQSFHAWSDCRQSGKIPTVTCDSNTTDE